MRLMLVLAGAAALCALAVPATAAIVTVDSGPGNSFATQTCDGPGGPFSNTTSITLTRTCSRSDVGEATGKATASVGHLGARAIATSHNGDSLAAGIGAEGIYSDQVIFTSSDPNATSTDVALNMLLDGVFGTGGGFNGGFIEGAVTLGSAFDIFQIVFNGTGLHVGQNSFDVTGTLGQQTDAVFTSHTVHVALNSPVNLVIRLQASANASGPGGFGLADFSGSFKFPTSGVFNLADGVTANAGDYLVNNHFIDPLAASAGVPEPATWSLMIAGFGLASAALRRRRVFA